MQRQSLIQNIHLGAHWSLSHLAGCASHHSSDLALPCPHLVSPSYGIPQDYNLSSLCAPHMGQCQYLPLSIRKQSVKPQLTGPMPFPELTCYRIYSHHFPWQQWTPDTHFVDWNLHSKNSEQQDQWPCQPPNFHLIESRPNLTMLRIHSSQGLVMRWGYQAG